MSIKSCLDCPSALSKSEAEAFFGVASLPGPMCARFGHVLGLDENFIDKAIETRAANCKSYGVNMPLDKSQSTVATFGMAFTPDNGRLMNPTPAGSGVSTCSDCDNYNQASQVCAALGKFIAPERVLLEASHCSFGKLTTNYHFDAQVGDPLEILAGQPVSVSLRNAVTSAPTATPKAPRKAPAHVKSPRLYESDAEVPADQVGMVRAYRKVETRVKDVFLPIFETDFFGDRAELIPDPAKGGEDPSMYVDHSGLLEDFAVMVWLQDHNLALIGEPGSGKTAGINWLAWMMNMPYTRIAFTEDTEADQILGTYQIGPIPGSNLDEAGNVLVAHLVQPDGSVLEVPKEKVIGTYLDLGELPMNWVQPGLILSDEFNLAQGPIAQTYRSMNDQARMLSVYKERLIRHDYCFHVGAINPHYDFRNIGTRPLASADSSRWAWREMPNPSKTQMKQILTSVVTKLEGIAPDPKQVEVVIRVGEDLREASRTGSLPDFWTLRQEIKVLRLLPYYGMKRAYDRAYFAYVDESVREIAYASIQSHVPSGVDWS